MNGQGEKASKQCGCGVLNKKDGKKSVRKRTVNRTLPISGETLFQ
jgi:hypothetical protein